MNFKKTGAKRNKLFSLLTLSVLILALALNFLFTYFGQKHTLFLDTTPEGLYSPTDKFIEECAFLDEIAAKEDGTSEIKVIFCSDPDILIENTGTRATYFTLVRLASIYKNLKIETVNVQTNPTAVAMYKATSLSTILPTDIIFAYGDRYRIINAQKMWTKGSSGTLFSYNGEYRIAGILKSVTAIDMPSAYFLIGHGETYFDPNTNHTYNSLLDAQGKPVPVTDKDASLESFAALLSARGLEIKLLDLSKHERVPEDCALLIINNPTEDFTYDETRLDELSYVSDIEKIDRYLVMNQGAVMINKDYAVTLPNFENFLYEWGFEFDNTQVKDSIFSLEDESNTQSLIISEYNKDENSYGYAIYGSFASLSSSPITVFSDSGAIKPSFLDGIYDSEAGTPNTHKRFVEFLSSSKNAMKYGKNELTGKYDAPASEAGVHTLAALSIRSEINTYTSEEVYSYLFCTASAEFFTNKLVSNASFANYDVLSGLIDNISRIDLFGSLDIGGTSPNSNSFGGKQLVSTDIGTEDTKVYTPDGKDVLRINHRITNAEIGFYTAVVLLIPIALAIYGTVRLIKRRCL
jgi:hypothetical protein